MAGSARTVDPSELLRRELPDGREIVVAKMLFTTRVCIGPPGDFYDDAWCYPTAAQALAAAERWNGKGDPPDGWVKQVGTERRRLNGDPALEFDGRHPPDWALSQ